MHTDSLPLFPLRIVLFPGIPQLLHVFEPRYRQLLADCLAEERRFGLSLIGEGMATPEPGDIGCSAVIKADTRLEDGRSNILTEGEKRFTIEALLPSDRPYQVAAVKFFEDDPPGPDDAGRAAAVWEDLERFRSMLTNQPSGETLPADPSRASFRIAAHLDLGIDIQEELARLTSTGLRLTRLEEIIRDGREATVRAMEAANRYRGNGKGRYQPEHFEPYE